MAPERLAQLSVEQKVALLAGADTWHTVGIDEPPVPPIRMSDGPAGVRGTSWTGPPSALFPCGAALGATFDPDLVREVGRALGREARTKNVHVVLGPTVNMQRTPIGGRNFECYSEDPVLTSEIAVAYIEGLQHEGLAACVKHLVGNDTEYQRMSISAEIDEATLREIYLAPFEAAVRRAGVRVMMTGYNRLNGTFCSEHPWLLTTVLREEWGFDGVLISDWFGSHSTAASLLAGVDVEMPGPPLQRGEKLLAALDAGDVTEADLDRSVERLLALADRVGAAESDTTESSATDDATRRVIRRAAISATVLLKNAGPTLPLPSTTRRVALIGPHASHGQPQGGGSAAVTPERICGPLEAIAARGFDVTFETGGAIAKFLPSLAGAFEVTFFDEAGHTMAAEATRLKWYWEQPPSAEFDGPAFGARIRGGFVPDRSGPWEVGAYAVGAVTVRFDGATVVSVPEGQHGGAYFGLGSPEQRATVELEAGRRYEVEVEYPVVADQLVRGLAVGVRPVELGDPVASAAAAAATSDVAVVIVGTTDEFETEGEDRTTLSLPGRQDELVAAVVAANPNTVVVLNCGSPVTMPWLDDVPAVLQLWFPGQEIGEALADVLTGEAEPGGRLPITFPRDLAETPAAASYPGTDGRAVYGEGLLVGHRWYDRNGVEPLFPFGHGLGYTTFTIEAADLQGRKDDGVTVAVDVANTGGRRGSEIVQVYIEPAATDATRPVRTLAAFRKVTLDAGAVGRISVEIPPGAFRVWTAAGWAIPDGECAILVGRSSRQLVAAGTIGG